MRIAIAQIATQAGDFEATADRMISLSYNASAQGVDLLVFPLASLTGPYSASAADAEDYLVGLAEALVRLSDELACPAIVPLMGQLEGQGLPEAVFMNEGIVLPLHTLAMMREGDADDNPGDAGYSQPLCRLDLSGITLGVALSYDDIDAFCSSDPLTDVLIYLSPYGFATNDVSSAMGGSLLEGRFPDDARDADAWFVGVGSLGAYGASVFTGASFVLTPEGELVASLPSFEEGFLVAEVGEGGLSQEGVTPEVYNRPLFLWQALVLGLQDLVKKIGARGAVIGLDGSVGSMVACALATDALGPTNVHAIVDVPGNVAREACCQRLARNLRIDVRDTADMRALRGLSQPDDAVLRQGIVGAYLAAWADELGALPLSGLDKTGLALGGEGRTSFGTWLAPAGDVYRSDLLALMRMRNTMSPIFPQVSLLEEDAPEVGVPHTSYAAESWCVMVDRVLADRIEFGKSVAGTLRDAQDFTVARAVLSMMEQAAQKRQARCVPLAVSTRVAPEMLRPPDMGWGRKVPQTPPAESENPPAPIMDLFNRIPMGSVPGASDEDVEEAVREAISYMTDLSFSQGPDLGMADGPAEGDAPPKGGSRPWPSPFSEN